jgi:hypothetical protein
MLIVALALLKYFFNWSIFDAAASEQGRGTIKYIRDVLNLVWSYIGAPVRFIWHEVVLPLLGFLWDAFKSLLSSGRGATN